MERNTRRPHPVAPPAGALRHLGGRVSLDFVNTVDPRHGEQQREYLTKFEDFVRWCEDAGALPSEAGLHLLEHARNDPAAADRAFADALALRDTLYELFSSIAAGARPDGSALHALNQGHGEAMSYARVVPAHGGFTWEWDEAPLRTHRPLWPIVKDAVELLTAGRPERIRECPGADGCGWLFYDTSRNGKRRWCSMEVCGNRAKGRRHYARHRNPEPDPRTSA